MAQFARPSSDIAVNGWTPTPLYQQIDESTYSDSDYIGNNAVSYCEVGLSSLNDPDSSSGHVVRYRYGRDNTGRTITLVVRLYQGSTEIASWEHVNPSQSFVGAEQTLTGTQADSITDYTDLRLRFDITAIQNNQVYGQISWAEFEVPDAGTDTDTSISSYLKGKQSTDSSVSAYMRGGQIVKSSQSAHVSSVATERSFVNAYLSGKDTSTSHVNAYLSGNLGAYGNLPAFLLGGDIAGTLISAFTYGVYAISTSAAAYLEGTSTAPISAIIKISLIVPTSVASDSKTSISAFMLPREQITHSVSVYLKGRQDTKTSQPVYLIVGTTNKSSVPIYLYGVRARSHSISAYLYGQPLITSSRSAFLSGRIASSSSINAFVTSMECESTGFISVYMSGVIRASIPCFVSGLIKRVDYIELKTSDSGATLSKRFLVLKQDYDDGTLEKSEDTTRTISGGTLTTVGKIYTTWNMIIRVPVDATDARYGTHADLAYLYSLNDPKGSPSNIITFVDHRGYEYQVIISGELQQNIITTAVEGPDAVFLCKLQLIGV